MFFYSYVFYPGVQIILSFLCLAMANIEQAAYVVLTPEADSFGFDERCINVNVKEPVTIGWRTAYFTKKTNAFFSTKMLHVKHASMWYLAGEFILTNCDRSTTYVNSRRLFPGETINMKSGDIVQFGGSPKFGEDMCVKAKIGLWRDGFEIEGNQNFRFSYFEYLRFLY